MTGSLEEVGKLETSHGRDSGPPHTESEISWRITPASRKSLVLKGYYGMIKPKNIICLLCSLLVIISEVEGSRTGVL